MHILFALLVLVIIICYQFLLFFQVTLSVLVSCLSVLAIFFYQFICWSLSLPCHYSKWLFSKHAKKDVLFPSNQQSRFLTLDMFQRHSWRPSIFQTSGNAIGYQYTGACLSGHSQQRLPSLMWPQHFVTTTMNAFTSPVHERPPL